MPPPPGIENLSTPLLLSNTSIYYVSIILDFFLTQPPTFKVLNQHKGSFINYVDKILPILFTMYLAPVDIVEGIPSVIKEIYITLKFPVPPNYLVLST